MMSFVAMYASLVLALEAINHLLDEVALDPGIFGQKFNKPPKTGFGPIEKRFGHVLLFSSAAKPQTKKTLFPSKHHPRLNNVGHGTSQQSINPSYRRPAYHTSSS